MWRRARGTDDDEAMVRMCGALNDEDPGDQPVPEAHMRRTLAVLRAEPGRGRALVLEVDGVVRGYALVIASWSNELGGEVQTIDELWVAPGARGLGHATALLEELAASPGEAVAFAVEVTPKNARARRLYERLGFRPRNQLLVRRVVIPGAASP